MDLVTNLRQLEGINTSFDYGVELVVMAVKEGLDWDSITENIARNEETFAGLFDYDRVCKKGFMIAKEYFNNVKNLNKHYLDFIREFRYCTSIYAMISEYFITLNYTGMGKIWMEQRVADLSEMLADAGFKFNVSVGDNDVEFVVLGYGDFSL